MIHRVSLPNGEQVPALGQGTWRMGEGYKGKGEEIAALRLGIELGMTLVDTAEMYGEGQTEILVGEAIGAVRDEVFLVSKVIPHNASRAGVIAACERSLRRLRTAHLDLYLLHWRGSHPIADTVAGFEELRSMGKIRHWGVSNFDTSDMEDLVKVPGGNLCASDQILYNITRRGPESDLISWLRSHGIPVMAYSPVEQGRLAGTRALDEIARRHRATRIQVALAWLLQKPQTMVIPKAATQSHVRENRKAADLLLSAQDIAEIDRTFMPPARKGPLEML